MDKIFLFRCTENLKAPPIKIETEWEAAEMRRHPFYEEIDEGGNVLARPNEAVKVEVPFEPEPAASPRATLKLSNKRVSR